MGWHATEVLTAWGELAARVSLMLELARAGRWQQLPELDAHCDAVFRQLQDMDADGLSAQERARTLALALRIRADQEALQALTRPQFLRLVAAVDGLRRAGGQ